MKLSFSRKGFDSSFGGMASPILPDGRMVSLPIPSLDDLGDSTSFADVNCPDIDMAKLISDLSNGKHHIDTRIDPDLNRLHDHRKPGWRPSLGQTGSAQGHLRNEGVGKGDVFLFFGWFRCVQLYDGCWRYEKESPNQHVIFGWLEVEDVLSIVTNMEDCLLRYPWIAEHPHVAKPCRYNNKLNTLYISYEASRFCTKAEFGGGVFHKYSEALRLTKAGHPRSVWSLPSWFYPNGRNHLTYNSDIKNWDIDGETATLRTFFRGQEFVIDGSLCPELEEWLKQIITQGNHQFSSVTYKK